MDPGKPVNFFGTEEELASFVDACRNVYEHAVVESNAWAREERGDVIVFIEGIPGQTDYRDDVDLLRSVSHLHVSPSASIHEWRRVLQRRLPPALLREAVCDVLAKSAMITLHQAFEIVDETLADARVDGETIPVRSALGRVLYSEQVSRLDLPPFDKSAMDGYAVPADDIRDEYRLLETIAAGETGRAQLAPGCAVKVMTGAAVPEGTGRVIKVEDTESHNGLVHVRRHDSASNVCRKAEDIRRGQTVLAAGTTLGALEIANLIACGIIEVEVARRVRIAIISTGDELVDSPALLTSGKIMDCNGPLLAGLSKEFGLVVMSEACLPDDRGATVEGIRTALECADIVALSGGVSAGDFDHVGEALTDAGLNVHFSRVAVKPGLPMTYASKDERAVFGLPGNPVTAYLMFHLFVLRGGVADRGSPARA